MTGSGYLIPAASRPQRPVKAVTFASAKWAHLDDGAQVAVRCSIGRYGDTTDVQRDDADLVDLAVAELTAYAGFRGRPVAERVTRWGGGLPQYAVGHRARVARIRAAVAAQPGLAVCGAAYDGVGVPACIRTGRRAAAEVRQVEVVKDGGIRR
jgi:oxygen-dependent protoporphyrinogen oxidase